MVKRLTKMVLVLSIAWSGAALAFEEVLQGCFEPYSAALAKSVVGFGCDQLEITRKLLAAHEGAVPKYIYHYGEKKSLLEDAEQKNIPQIIWDEIVMGEGKARFALPEIRRGLYGTRFLDSNRYYSADKYNWLMRIEIKDQCRAKNKVGVISAEMLEDHRFSAWLKKHPEAGFSPSLWKRDCDIFRYEHAFEGNQGEKCNAAVAAFMRDSGFKVILDGAEFNSFYIRDRTCIADIKSKPEDLLEILADSSELWVEGCGLNLPGNSRDIFLLNLLADPGLKSRVNPELLKKLRFNVELMSIPLTAPMNESTKFYSGDMDSYPEDKTQMKNYMMMAIDSSERCQALGKIDEWQRLAHEILGPLDNMRRVTTAEEAAKNGKTITPGEDFSRLGKLCR